MPESDLQLLARAARAAGDLATGYWRRSPRSWEKAEGAGPVTEADIAVNELLKAELMAARPDYGWLSEESEDDPARLARRRVFVVDPIDGTRAFIAGERSWAHSLAVAEGGRVTAAVIHLPMLGKLYAATPGGGAYLNDTRIRCAARPGLAGAQVLCARANLDPGHWPGGVPALERHFRPSLAYRLALVAEGRFDAMITFRDTWEWDVAAGALIAAEAGAMVTDRHFEPPRFNNPRPALRGMLVASCKVHEGLRRHILPAS